MPRTGRHAAERFAEKVDRNGPLSIYRGAPGPCHLWTAGTFHDRGKVGEFGEGYAAFTVDGRRVLAHRYAYEQERGPIGTITLPDGTETPIELDHRCHRRNCVNVAHLEPVTHAENMRRTRGRPRRRRAAAVVPFPTPETLERAA